MAGKRGATSDLNHDNWDREEIPEEAGTFKRANDDTLKGRIIKTARRRNPISRVAEEESGNKNIFSNVDFTKSTSGSSSKAFSFLSNISTQSTASLNSFGSQQSQKVTSPTSSEPSEKSKETYYSKLKGLNESVSKWIQKHVDENPFVNLQPIFDDYKKFYEELDKDADSSPKKEEGKKSEPDSSTKLPSVSGSEFTSSKPMSSSIFSFGAKSTAAPTTFSFGSLTTSASTSQPIIFGNLPATTQSKSNGFSFFGSSTTTSVTAPSSTFATFAPTQTSTFVAAKTPVETTENGDNATEDEPPKVEFTPVVEKDHLYTIRCKVFVKKDGGFGDRGVGNLFLKPIENSEKVQLIVRADTNLGNLLCNFILSESIPLQRLGKKDVMLVCLPTPETAPPPVPILLRVKSPEEADSLLEVLQKHKK